MKGVGEPLEERLIVGGTLTSGWSAALAGMTLLTWGPSVILFMSFGVFAPAFVREFGWSIGAVSIGATILSLTVAMVSPVQGFLVDRLGPRRVVLLSLPLFGLGLLGFSRLGGDIRLYYLGCFILPVLGFGLWPLSSLRLASSWFDRRLGLALGVVNLGPGLGAAVMPAIIGTIMAAYDWRAAYLFLATILFLAILPLSLRWLRENPSAAGAAPGQRAAFAAGGLELGEVLRDRSFWLLAVSFALLGFLSSGVLIHQVNILIDHGISEGSAIALQALLGLASICGRLLAGWLLDRMHLSRLMFGILIAGAAAALLFASPMTGPLLALSAVTFGLLLGAEFDVLAYAICRYFGMRTFGRVYGLSFAVFQVGAAGGALMMGQVRDATGSYSGGLIGIAVLCVVCALMFLSLGAYRFKPVEAEDEGGSAGGALVAESRS